MLTYGKDTLLSFTCIAVHPYVHPPAYSYAPSDQYICIFHILCTVSEKQHCTKMTIINLSDDVQNFCVSFPHNSQSTLIVNICQPRQNSACATKQTFLPNKPPPLENAHQDRCPSG